MNYQIPAELIIDRIYLIRNKKVMLSHDLAELYQVETKRLNEQVRRNLGRFPDRYMFKLTAQEYNSLRSQNATLKRGQHTKYPPYAFTEHGVLMLSSVLRSSRAEKINILIVDVFVELNKSLLDHKDVLLTIEKLKQQVNQQDEKVELLFNYLKKFIKTETQPPQKIGFKLPSDSKRSI
jgi:phage regulator Rha-like protein